MRTIILLLIVLISLPALASDPELQGEYQKWQVYHYQESNGPVCYAVTHAEKTTNLDGVPMKIKGRGRVLLQITRRVAEGNGLVFSYVAGQSIKSKTEVLLTAGKAHFHLRGDGDTAWTKNPGDDADIVKAFRTAKKIVIIHGDRKGIDVLDSFSVKGAVDALGILSDCD